MAEQFLTLMADLDDESQAKMTEWYEELRKHGYDGEQTPGLAFHISLGSFPLDREKEVTEMTKRLSEGFSRIPVYISHIDVFPGDKVLFCAPDMNPELLALHNDAVKEGCIQDFEWTPHVTMIIDKPEVIAQARPVLEKAFKPFCGKIARLHLCAFWPTREIVTYELREKQRLPEQLV